ncbi:retrovirus-related pol polyprotein from transposon TNT 1-94 [Tanacetum coccineum]
MDTCKNGIKSDTLMSEQFQKFVNMYEQFEIFLAIVEQLKNFLASKPHAMSTSSNKGIGSIDTPYIALSDVYYIPSLTMNLASVNKICDSGCDVNFSDSDCSIYDQKTQEVVGTGHRQGDLYVLDHFRYIHAIASSSVDLSSFWLNPLGKIDAHDISDCSGCKLAKFSALPFSNSVSSFNAPFDLVHSDVWGPSPVSIKGDSKYYVSFINDFTRYTWVYLMKHRSDFLTVFKEFRALVKTQHSTVMQCFCCDLGGEYTSNDFVGLLKSDGTLYQNSCTDTPRQNSVAKRKHRHIVKTTRSFLLLADVPSVFWGEADLTVTYVINRIPTSHNSALSPFEKLYGTLPDYSSLRVFGCTCFVLKPHVERTKLSLKSTLCVFLSYGVSQKGYRCYDLIGQKLYTSHHVQFLEHILYYSVPASSHNLTQSELIKIDPFKEPTHVVSPIIPEHAFETISEPTTTETPPISDTPPQTTTATKKTIASSRKWKIFQLDVKNAFLNGDLNEEVLMKPPPGVSHKPREVYKFKKALYGLKQAPRAWYEKFATVVTSLGFVSSHHDSALFVKQSSAGPILFSLYVDDMIITGDDCVGIESLKLELTHRFAMKDLGLLSYFLGIEVASSPKGYLLSQSKYIGDLLDHARTDM